MSQQHSSSFFVPPQGLDQLHNISTSESRSYDRGLQGKPDFRRGSGTPFPRGSATESYPPRIQYGVEQSDLSCDVGLFNPANLPLFRDHTSPYGGFSFAPSSRKTIESPPVSPRTSPTHFNTRLGHENHALPEPEDQGPSSSHGSDRGADGVGHPNPLDRNTVHAGSKRKLMSDSVDDDDDDEIVAQAPPKRKKGNALQRTNQVDFEKANGLFVDFASVEVGAQIAEAGLPNQYAPAADEDVEEGSLPPDTMPTAEYMRHNNHQISRWRSNLQDPTDVDFPHDPNSPGAGSPAAMQATPPLEANTWGPPMDQAGPSPARLSNGANNTNRNGSPFSDLTSISRRRPNPRDHRATQSQRGEHHGGRGHPAPLPNATANPVEPPHLPLHGRVYAEIVVPNGRFEERMIVDQMNCHWVFEAASRYAFERENGMGAVSLDDFVRIFGLGRHYGHWEPR
ncbi:hypothetical protein EJ05DRAFT_504545 [Pseudovirgaria hyperparasitica]|uniref:Uncharacterized protein n=1 Tax=Pseudovirgaria hyperparasitica TaxID=470096 RepID=A0A6A6VXF8_9PEZI|nr:uncharacterized protein EJ05DRAFT_504545 [Pseudovirgaria hyperparasitica]KAF2753947.1 hypothetical protein EJ05DRAFT_504545 [Pseudovirgaria hyperparasitica]